MREFSDVCVCGKAARYVFDCYAEPIELCTSCAKVRVDEAIDAETPYSVVGLAALRRYIADERAYVAARDGEGS